MTINPETGHWEGEPGSAPNDVFDPNWGHPSHDPDHLPPARFLVVAKNGRRYWTNEPGDGRILSDRLAQ